MIELFKNMAPVHRTFSVTLEVYNAFQQCSGDRNPLHTDEAFARSKGFPACVMYGNILNAFVSTLIGMCLPTPDVMIQSQDIAYRKPVFMGDVLEAEMAVGEVFECVNVVELKFTFRNQHNKVVAKGHVQIGLI